MRVELLQEGDLTGTTAYERYHQLIGEVELADRLGFSTWGTSEQHFSPPSFSIAAREVLYSAIAMRTSRITLRTMASVMLRWNHPILVVERLATLDIVSHGRAEVCTARSNNLTTLDAFGVDPAETRDQWEDGMDVTVPPRRSERVSEEIPAELRNRCAAVQDCDAQGIPLTASDYVWLAVATVVVPVLLVIIGLML
ncbi:LLM class flavin-dependent oxidoreductase [Mycolicibacterium baixiangningiae]|uniref:LLM class flavin-dependent oxidoreductase n=1 Tax=Mycolicibacterium baixiangningiae TaxID=2761578 RepID=UPI001D00E6D5|nr:LLM class flavin-dependent oxidoreductase [Mycolicibacterium baixiangningiae]